VPRDLMLVSKNATLMIAAAIRVQNRTEVNCHRSHSGVDGSRSEQLRSESLDYYVAGVKVIVKPAALRK